MAKTTHTPGPWHVHSEDLRGGKYWSVNRPSYQTRDVDYAEPIDIHEHDNGEADAHLIAAAPDLLEALDSAPVMSQYHGRYFESERFIEDYEKWRVKVRAAIAKARGEA